MKATIHRTCIRSAGHTATHHGSNGPIIIITDMQGCTQERSEAGSVPEPPEDAPCAAPLKWRREACALRIASLSGPTCRTTLLFGLDTAIASINAARFWSYHDRVPSAGGLDKISAAG